MHPTPQHMPNDVDNTNHNHLQNLKAATTLTNLLTSATLSNIDKNGLSYGTTDRKLHEKEQQNNNETHKCNGDVTSLINDTVKSNGYQNGSTRKNSTNVWSPLLQASADNNLPTEHTETVLFGPSVNNNEWRDSEKMNNIKNGLLHYNNGHNHQHNHNTHHLPQGNNNGSLLNGKHGNGISDKYDEQDPLTGLCKPKQLHTCESDSSDSSESNDQASNCGLFGCQPKWARSFASTHVFMVIFLLAYILQGMYLTYFVSVITTIEKLFQIKSRTTGFLLSASEMGQISTAMLLTYFAGSGHRPRWIACGMVLFSIAAFSCALPHFIFGDQLIESNNIMHSNVFNTEISEPTGDLVSHLTNSFNSQNDLNLCLVGNSSSKFNAECDEARKLEQASHSKITVIVLCIFFISLLSSGIGQTAVATLGIPYIDDNVASKQSPIYMAITIGVRILGPASGLIIGSMCTRWYVNFSDPGFDASDPRWIGAWWMGPMIIGTLMMLASIAMFSFPKQLHGHRETPISNSTTISKGPHPPAQPEEKPKLKDFPKTVRRQLSNDILMFRTASCVFHLLPIAGLYTFLPKYLETQFRLAAYDANMIAAFCGILVMGFGIVISGIFILKVKPSARSIAAWIAFTALFYSAGMVVLMFIGCNMSDFAGFKHSTSQIESKQSIFQPTCNLNCSCDMESFAPICGQDGKTYFSSCHAGCSALELRSSDNRTVFSNCACIPDLVESKIPYEAVSGYCDTNCKNFIFFILIFVVCVFMHSTSEVGSMLVVMRCTHPKDKAMAMGVIQSAIGLFGNVPCPIIYGAVVDSACLVWKTVCGKHGACTLYNTDTFRHHFLGITASIMFLAFIMDLVVWSKAHRIDIAPADDDKLKTDCKNPITSPDTTV